MTVHSRWLSWLFSLAALCLLGGCASGTQQTKLPVYTRIWYIQAPVQQTLLSTAIDRAVDQLAEDKNQQILKKYEGKTAYISISGVFPYKDDELMNYVRQRTEYQMSRAGILISRAKRQIREQSFNRTSTEKSNQSGESTFLVQEDIPETDLLINIDVSAAGADIIREREPLYKWWGDRFLDLVVVGWFLDDMYERRMIYAGRTQAHISVLSRLKGTPSADFSILGYEEYKYEGKDTKSYPLRYYQVDWDRNFFEKILGL